MDEPVDLFVGRDAGAVILAAERLADAGVAQVGEPAQQVHRDVAGPGDVPVPAGAFQIFQRNPMASYKELISFVWQFMRQQKWVFLI